LEWREKAKASSAIHHCQVVVTESQTKSMLEAVAVHPWNELRQIIGD
jgi:hypothetical protein